MVKVNLKIRQKQVIINAPMWKRIFAFIIDYFILNIILSPFTSLIERILGVDSFKDVFNMISSNGVDIGSLMYIYFFMAVITLLYFYILEKRYGQTIGKILMKIYITSTEKKPNIKDLGSLPAGKAFIRSLSIVFLFTPLLVITLVDFIYVFFNKDRQRLFERGSQTKTIAFVIL